MLFTDWLRDLRSALALHGVKRPLLYKPVRYRRAAKHWPRLEVLEDRLTPSAITVTNSTDELDGNTSSIAALIGNPGADGTISLREAIQASNNSPGANSITFAPSLSGQPILLTQGELLITNAVTITGLGAANTTVDAQHKSVIFSTPVAGGAITLDGLTLTNGQGGVIPGGAISSSSTDLVTVKNSSLTGNSDSSNAGAIYSRGDVSVSNSSLSGNSSEGYGGAILGAQSVTISNSTISNNSALNGAGGIGAGSVKVNNSIISSNSARYGFGGGIAAGGMTLTNSTMSGNSSFFKGGGVYMSPGASATVGNSTICGNSAGTASYPGYGGGIYTLGTVTVSNSTIAGNSATNAGGGIFAFPLIPSRGTAVTVQSCIVAGNSGNSISPDLDLNANSSYGVNPATLTATNSLIGDNTGTGLTAAPVGAPDINGNMVGTSTAPINPLLVPLSNNGGPSQTMALLPGSPAIDTGANPDNLTSDQRGLPYIRTFGSQTDMGAFELQTLTAQQQIVLIANQVNTLVSSGALSSSNSNALTSKLNSATASFLKGNTTAGINQLNAFINQDNALMKSGKLTGAQAQALVSAANLAITAASGRSGAHLMNESSAGTSASADTQAISDAGQLVTGTIGVYLDNADGTPVTADEQARFDDALNVLDTSFGSYGVNLVDVGLGGAAGAIVQVEIAATSAAGSAADGVLGCTLAGQITLVTGWSWYVGADPSAIGAGQYDFETIVMHELGHAVGLGHSGDTGSVMYPYLAPGEARRGVTTLDMSVLEVAGGTMPEPLLVASGFPHAAAGINWSSSKLALTGPARPIQQVFAPEMVAAIFAEPADQCSLTSGIADGTSRNEFVRRPASLSASAPTREAVSPSLVLAAGHRAKAASVLNEAVDVVFARADWQPDSFAVI